MPRLSLVVCIAGERDLLDRLLSSSIGCYDDLLVVHDGPLCGATEQSHPIDAPPLNLACDYSTLSRNSPLPEGYIQPEGSGAPGSVHELVLKYKGRFFIGPKCWQQEPHWGFAWWQARCEWILRLDADEFPSEELKRWIADFRKIPLSEVQASGYCCFWPLWNGKRKVTFRWPYDRLFLFNKSKARFFGMVENNPTFDSPLSHVCLELSHQPKRSSYGVVNIIFRRQAARWRLVIARSLLGTPLELPRWRFDDSSWPPHWAQFVETPIWTGLKRLIKYPAKSGLTMLCAGIVPILTACMNPGMHYFLLGCRVFRETRNKRI